LQILHLIKKILILRKLIQCEQSTIPIPVYSESSSGSSRGALKRIQKELNTFALPNATLNLINNNMTEMEIKFDGPKGTPYENGKFILNAKLPADYPFKPPRIVFKTKIYHPNITESGGIGINLLRDNWSPALTIQKIVLAIVYLLENPDPNDPYRYEVATQLKLEPLLFYKTAQEWTVKHAT